MKVLLPEYPDRIEEVVLDGRSLTLEQVVAVARYRARVRLDPEAERRVALARAVVDRLVEDRAKVYGLNTGFGSKRNILIEEEELAHLQRNLIQSHSCGVGDPLPEDVVRAAMLLRANTLACGHSGVRPVVVQALLEFLNRDVYPWIPSQGSLGASGDLAPLSHLALALCNDSHARYFHREPDEPAPASPRGTGTPPDYSAQPVSWRAGPPPPELFGEGGLQPLVLQAKEGLALNNGTQVSTAIGLLAVFDAIVLLESAELVCGLSLEANMGIRDAFDPRLHAARPHRGQSETAANIMSFTENSQVLRLPINTARLGRVRRALVEAAGLLEGEGAEAAALAPRVRGAEEALNVFEARVLEGLEEGKGAASEGGRDRDRPFYREALAPLRTDVLGLYAEALGHVSREKVLKGRDFLADAVAQLQLALPDTPTVQDDYSFRCAPQVLGVARHVVQETLCTLVTEANSATDNPLIFPPRGESFRGDPQAYARSLTVEECRDAVVSGGNFHGEPVAMALDQLSMAMAELGSIAERRTAHLVDGNLSNGLPSLLVWNSGLNSGLMIPQYVAAALVSENKVLSHPASVDSIPTCENTEDHVSMSALAALKCRRIVDNTATVVAIELLTAFQGVSFRRPLGCGRATERLWQAMADAGMTPVQEDRVLQVDIDWTRRFLLEGTPWHIAREAAPPMLD
jgi:histidine ammonia-lyase